ncbi:hypothetical protein CLOM_g21836 [Closterium sp. NIES-68]|nr:hypothetical protein CLOM_g21836 [Closterium sp. NIES-68]GJP78458.1 hypothetical protein CLOP_g8753 [Closterium sp. NIES-67]
MTSVSISAKSFHSLARSCRRAPHLPRECTVPAIASNAVPVVSASSAVSRSATSSSPRFFPRFSPHPPPFRVLSQPSQAHRTSLLVTIMSHQQHRRQHHDGRQTEGGRQIQQDSSQQQRESLRQAAFPVSVADGRRFHNLLADYDPSQGAVARDEQRARDIGVPGGGGGGGGVTVTGEGRGEEFRGEEGKGEEGKGTAGARSWVGLSMPGVRMSLAVPSEEEFLRAGLELKDQIVAATWSNGAPSRRVRDPFLYVGLLGTAWVCFRAYQATGDAADLTLAADIIRAAADMAERHRTHYTFYCGQPGILALGAVIHHHLVQHNQQQQQQQPQQYLESNPYLRSFLHLLTSALPALSLLPSSPTDTAPATVPHELLYGRAGMLWAILFLRSNLPVELRKKALPLALARPIAAAIVGAGRSLASTYHYDGTPPPRYMYEWYDTRYLGAAHGVAGIAHVLLLLRQEELEEEEEAGATAESPGVSSGQTAEGPAGAAGGEGASIPRDRTLEEAAEAAVSMLEYLVANRLPSGNYAASDAESRVAAAAAAALREGSAGRGEPREVREADRLVHWCHGAPGVALALAHAVMLYPSKPHLLQAAIEAGEVVWHRGLLRRVGLCHGISGNAYTFLALHRATTAGLAAVPATCLVTAAAKSTVAPPPATSAVMTRHLHRAQAFAGFLHAKWRQLAEAGTLHCGDHRYSLMEGLGGPACLFLDMSRPNEARFPGYEL